MGKIDWKKWLKWLGIALLVYIIYKVISNRLESPKPPPVVIPPGGTTGTTSTPTFKYDPAKVNRTKPFGSGTNNSQEVGYVQTWLNAYYATNLKVDGDWGAKTSAAILLHKPMTNFVSTTLDAMGI